MRRQVEDLIDETRRVVGAAIRGETALEALEESLSSARSLAFSSLGNGFTLGINRVLTADEMQEAARRIREGAAQLNGVEIRKIDPRIDMDKYDSQSLQAIELLGEIVSALGQVRILCHPDVYPHIQELFVVREEYNEFVRQTAARMKDERVDAERRVWNDIQRKANRISAERKAARWAAKADAPKEEAHALTPPAQHNPSTRPRGMAVLPLVAGIAVILALTALVLKTAR